ncbi:two-component system, cell cycle sensor histidine kinase and response regulator CckA [Mariprofundus micogutta]|uniref:histidine kinase n=1 Tax=Mariprofundus micogutta TaxID=1921010 RepID=A0A1L8CMN2_9PROT|nr:PAS domain-containing sensor histidine kinase [Mariprofundus micogutta]GAV20167.1 two-component system, cell cycle sensor histidine kinase and response regulator CckA [Mariprofundus micogutta]
MEEMLKEGCEQVDLLAAETQKIKDNQAKYYRLLNAIHEVYYSADIEGNVTEISPSIGTVAGYDCSEIVGTPVTAFYKHPEDREKFLSVLQHQGYVTDYELELVHKKGYEVQVSANAHMMFDDKGQLLGVEGMLRDITDRVELERELKTLNEELELRVAERTAELEAKNLQLLKFSQAIEQAAEGFIIADCSGLVEYVNPAFEKINGYSSDEVIGTTLSVLNSGKHDADFFHGLWTSLRQGETWEGTIINRRKDGSEYPALMTIVPIKHDGEIDFYAAIQQDMSEYEKLEAQFQQAQKMDAIGTLAGGIAHDFNNMLAGMLMHLFLAKRDIANTDKALDKLNKVEQMGYQASDMLKNLLIFSRQESEEHQSLDLNAVLTDSFQLLRISIPDHVALKLDICDEKISVMGDITQLQQMLMNLLNNSRDALQSSSEGRITVTLQHCVPEPSFTARHPGIGDGELAEIIVRDNGCGIAEEDLARIFEPFFTTKEVGHGTGLGLAMVYGCIEKHHGVLEVESKPDEGAIFHIYLPIAQEPAVAVVQEEDRGGLYEGSGELILVADDNDAVRMGVVDALESLNYRTVQAADGEQALALFEEQPDSFDMVLLDMVMPRMSGRELARRVREIKPELPIIFTTGHDASSAIREVEMFNKMFVCEKPFKLKVFSWKMQTLLNAS